MLARVTRRGWQAWVAGLDEPQRAHHEPIALPDPLGYWVDPK